MPASCCSPIEKLIVALLVAAAAFIGSGLGVKVQTTDACPCAPATEIKPQREPPQVESGGQKAMVYRRRDGQWSRVEIKNGEVQETVISQGVVRPPGAGHIGESVP